MEFPGRGFGFTGYLSSVKTLHYVSISERSNVYGFERRFCSDGEVEFFKRCRIE